MPLLVSRTAGEFDCNATPLNSIVSSWKSSISQHADFPLFSHCPLPSQNFSDRPDPDPRPVRLTWKTRCPALREAPVPNTFTRPAYVTVKALTRETATHSSSSPSSTSRGLRRAASSAPPRLALQSKKAKGRLRTTFILGYREQRYEKIRRCFFDTHAAYYWVAGSCFGSRRDSAFLLQYNAFGYIAVAFCRQKEACFLNPHSCVPFTSKLRMLSCRPMIGRSNKLSSRI